MYNLSVRFDDDRKNLILTSGEFLTHRIKAQGVKITKNLPSEYQLQIIFAPLNNNTDVVERSFTNRALNLDKNLFVDLNFGDDSTGGYVRNLIVQDETVICFNNVSDQYTGEFMLMTKKTTEDGEILTLTDEDVELIKNNVTVEPTDVFDYKGWMCRAIDYPDNSNVDEDYENRNIGIALLPPTDDPNKSMSFIYRVPPMHRLIVDYGEEWYDDKIYYCVFDGDSLVGFNGMIEDEEHFRYCLPMWSPLLLRFPWHNDDWDETLLAPDPPIFVGEHDGGIGSGDELYANQTSSTVGVVVHIPKYKYRFILQPMSD